MASALNAQLMHIQSRSLNPLNLKTQVSKHAQSLLFDEQTAASQDFESIHQVCYEGFQELCQLDARFFAYDGSIFGEASKHQDRTQVSAARGEELNVTLEHLLGLLGDKLLLRSALKAVEWLIRRFRVHEYNTTRFATIFLPYHGNPIFTSMLSLLPTNLPQQLRFLGPHVQSPTNPTRHTLVHIASLDRNFFTAFTQMIFEIYGERIRYTALISLWGSIAIERIAQMLHDCHSASLKCQDQKREDILRLFLPIINDGLLIPDAQEIRVACYMILIVLASKVDFQSKAMSGVMRAVVVGWEQSSHAGLICLAVLARRSHTKVLPWKVVKALCCFSTLCNDLLTLRESYQIDHLVLGIVLRLLCRLSKNLHRQHINLIENLLGAGLLHESSLIDVLAMIQSIIHTKAMNTGKSLHLRQHLDELILRLSHSRQVGKIVREFTEVTQRRSIPLEEQNLSSEIDGLTAMDLGHVKIADVSFSEVKASLVGISSKYADDIDHATSFLSHSQTSLYDELEKLFCSIHHSAVALSALLHWPVLKWEEAMTEPIFLSFLIRLWCGHSPPDARAAALRAVADYLDQSSLVSDVQILLPYVMYALADTSYQVRQAATGLVLALSKAWPKVSPTNEVKSMRSTSGMRLFYGHQSTSTEISWLTCTDLILFVDAALIPRLEECLLDEQCSARILKTSIIGSKSSDQKPNIRRLQTSAFRTALFTSICSHVVASPIYSFKLRLLRTVNQVESISGTTRTKLLLPLEAAIAAFGDAKLDSTCKDYRISTADLFHQIASIFTCGDREGILRLRHMIEDRSLQDSQKLKAVLLRRIVAIWPDMSADLQLMLLRPLVRAAIGEPCQLKVMQEAATDTLKHIHLSTSSLQALLNGLPKLADATTHAAPAAKRRRTSPSQTSADNMPHGDSSYRAVQEYSIILDLITTSEAEQHPEILASLFQVAHDLRFTSLTYLQVSALESILTILLKVRKSTSSSFSISKIRGDVIVEYIRITCNPQVRNIALLVASALAEVAPDQILHLVMPIFAYMGANILRQEDEYSVHVVDRVMERVIPRLVDSLTRDQTTKFNCLTELLHSFAGAFEHIPTHRRLILFVSLLAKIGPLQYLSVLIALLMVKYPGNKKVMQFCFQLTCEFDIVVQLKAIEGYVKIVLDAQIPEMATRNSLELLQGSEDPMTMVVCLLPFIEASAQSDRLLSRTMSILRGSDTTSAIAVKASFSLIFQHLLLLIKSSKAMPKIVTLYLDALNATFGMIPIPQLLEIVEDLLDRLDDDLRLHILRFFERRISIQIDNDRVSQISCLAFIPCLTRLVEGSTDSLLQRSAVSTMDQIIEKYGKIRVAEVLRAATIISGNQCLGPTSQPSVRAASLLCLSTMIEVAGDMIVPIMPTALSRALANLDASMITDTKDCNLHDAAYSVVQALLLYVPWMMTSVDLDLILMSLHRSANIYRGPPSNVSRLQTARTLSKQINAKDCLAAMYRTRTSALEGGPKTLSEYTEMLGLMIDHMPRCVVVGESAKLTDIFIQLFDLRRHVFCSCDKRLFDDQDIDKIEAAVNKTAVAMICKLNDATLKPIFARLVGHAAISHGNTDGNIYRHITWYTFLVSFFGSFKSIVTSYADFVIMDTVHVIRHVDPMSDASIQLWRLALQTLRITFEHDQDDFYRRTSDLKAIMTALTSQLALSNHLSMNADVIPTIVELAVASSSLCHHKELNSLILILLRSGTKSSRLAALLCERALTDRLGEDWLAMLPEMLPVIAELQEDDDDIIEKEALRWVQRIEDVLGENVHSMLQ